MDGRWSPHGIDYPGTAIGEGAVHKGGMEDPVYYRDPVIAPSGLAFYTGTLFPQWQGRLFVGSLSGRLFDRLTIVNAYWNAGWMFLFGESWRALHAVAAVCSAAAVVLSAGYVRSRFPVPEWRLPGAMAASLFVGLNVLVVRYGGVAQAYGLCLLAITAAYRLTVASAERERASSVIGAGFCCGAAAASSLLTAPTGPVLLVWLLRHRQPGKRLPTLLFFLFGGLLPFLPLLWLAAQGPRRVFFGIFEYNFRYRLLDWPGAISQNVDVLGFWIDSGQGLLLVLLTAGGLLWIHFRSDWQARRKSELSLCAWLALASAAYLSLIRPTFKQYYMLTVPFLGILAVAGLFVAASRLHRPDRPWTAFAVLAFLLCFGLTNKLILERDDFVWADFEQIARQVNRVTTPSQTLFADEAIYFLTRHPPPSGMEMRDSHKFSPSLSHLEMLHILPQAELDRRVRAGAFSTLETCFEKDEIDRLGYAKVYNHVATAAGCTIFWDTKTPAGSK